MHTQKKDSAKKAAGVGPPLQNRNAYLVSVFLALAGAFLAFGAAAFLVSVSFG